MSARRTTYVLHSVPIERAKVIRRDPSSVKLVALSLSPNRFGIVRSNAALNSGPPDGVRLGADETNEIVAAWRKSAGGSGIREIAAARVVVDFVGWLSAVSRLS